MKTLELLDALAARYSLRSDYAIAKFLGVSKTTVNRYRHKMGQLGEEEAVKVAELLDLDPAQVLAEIQAERTNCPAAKAHWERLAQLASLKVAA